MLGVSSIKVKALKHEIFVVPQIQLKTLRALCHGDLKSPPNDFKPPNQSSLPNSEDQECHGDLEYDGEESDIAIFSDE